MFTRLLVAPTITILIVGGCGTTPQQQNSNADTSELALVKTIAGSYLSVSPAQIQSDVPIGQMKPPMDELDLVELVMELEDRLQISISDEDLVAEAGADKPGELCNCLTLRGIANVAGRIKKSDALSPKRRTMFSIEVTNEGAVATDRDTVGGAPHLPLGEAHPRCKQCSVEMALFLQFDVRREFGLPFQPGSHLMVFMCPHHNEIPTFPKNFDNTPLPEMFWEHDDGHYSLILVPATKATEPGQLDRFIEARRIRFVKAEEVVRSHKEFTWGSHGFKVGGAPGWLNYAVEPNCPCGGAMRFVCQIPDGFGFGQTRHAPEPPDSFSRSEYCLFLGNQVCILACERQCNSRSVIAVCDN